MLVKSLGNCNKSYRLLCGLYLPYHSIIENIVLYALIIYPQKPLHRLLKYVFLSSFPHHLQTHSHYLLELFLLLKSIYFSSSRTYFFIKIVFFAHILIISGDISFLLLRYSLKSLFQYDSFLAETIVSNILSFSIYFGRICFIILHLGVSLFDF